MQSPAGQPQVSGQNVTGGKKSAEHLRYATRRTPLNPYFVLGICALGIAFVSFMSWDIEQVNIGPLKTKYAARKEVVLIPFPGNFPPSEEHPEGTRTAPADPTDAPPPPPPPPRPSPRRHR